MKIKRAVLLAAIAAALAAAGAGRAGAEERGRAGGERERSGEKAERREDGGRRMIRLRNISMPRPERLEPGRIVNDNRRVEEPRRYGNGEEIRERSAKFPPDRHSEIVGDPSLRRAIERERDAERTRNRYYWHNSGGKKYSHFRDADDIDWYGFYFGPSFYWTRYYADRWWWYDPGYARWVFWWNGYWWWQGPGGTASVYLDNEYYPYQEGGVTVKSSATVSPAEAKPVPGTGKQWTSPDMRRMVEVTGTEDAAFLYDRTGGSPVYLCYLGRGVSRVRFSGGVTGQPLLILLDFKDGSFALFDADGKPEQPEAPVPAPPLPAAPPVSAPGSPAPGGPN